MSKERFQQGQEESNRIIDDFKTLRPGESMLVPLGILRPSMSSSGMASHSIGQLIEVAFVYEKDINGDFNPYLGINDGHHRYYNILPKYGKDYLIKVVRVIPEEGDILFEQSLVVPPEEA